MEKNNDERNKGIMQEIIEKIGKYEDGNDVMSVINGFQSDRSKIKDSFKSELKKLIGKHKRSSPGNFTESEIMGETGENNFKDLVLALKRSKSNFLEDLYVVINEEKKTGMEWKRIKLLKAKYTYLISGTNDVFKSYSGKDNERLKKLSQNYFLPDKGKEDPSGDASVKKFAKYLNPDSREEDAFFINWQGENDKESRDPMAVKVAGLIMDKINKDPDAAFNLIGHSHGGNIMVKAINILYNDPDQKNKIRDSIINLITLSPPIRNPIDEPDYHISRPISRKIRHINIFCPFDFVQKIGWIDADKITAVIVLMLLSAFFSLIHDLCNIWSHHKFRYSENIKFLWKDNKEENERIYDMIWAQVVKDKGCPLVRRHQITRSVDFVIDLLNKRTVRL